MSTVIFVPEAARQQTEEVEEKDLNEVIDGGTVRHCAVSVVVHVVASLSLHQHKETYCSLLNGAAS